MSRYVFFTFRPQINDQDLFEDFLKLFLPFIKSHSEYVYSVENDGMLTKHIHAVMLGKYADKDKFFQKWNKTNGLVGFKTMCKKFTNTDENGFDTKLVPDTDNDKLHVIGYTCKEITEGRGHYNMTEDLITKSLEFYHAHKRIKAKEKSSKDWTLITTKNVYAHIEDYIEKNEIKLPDPLLTTKLSSDRYGLCNITSRQIRLVQAEIHLARCKDTGATPHMSETDEVFNYGIGASDIYKEDITPVNQQLMDALESLDRTEGKCKELYEIIKQKDKEIEELKRLKS